MIVFNLNNGNPYGYKVGQATKIQAPTLPKIPAEVPEVCPCEVQGCEDTYKVFGNLSDTGADYSNDKTSVMLRTYTASDSVSIYLEKNGVEVAQITDNTYGEYYQGFTGQPDYIGLVLEWVKVLQAHGAGYYQLRYDTTIIGNTTTKKSIRYHLLPFSNEAANGTVRLTWKQSGSIRSNAFDFTGINWVQQIRFNGYFGNETPTLEVDNYVRENYKREQIQDRLNFDYDLDLDPIVKELGDPLINDAILGNEVTIDDYNLSNYKPYINFRVMATAVDTSQEWYNSINKKFIIKFTKRFANDIKTNYGE